MGVTNETVEQRPFLYHTLSCARIFCAELLDKRVYVMDNIMQKFLQYVTVPEVKLRNF